MSSDKELEDIYNFIEPLVCSSGQVMRSGYLLGKEKKFKTKNVFYDLVTEYDKKIEDLLINGIKEKYSNHKFIAEEDFAINKNKLELTDEPTWIIDPIDGTTNFIKNIPHACISIGLTINKEIVLGIIYNPISNELYSARKDKGSFLNGQKISINNNVQKLNDAVLGYEISLIHAPEVRDKNLKRIYKLGSKAQGTRSFGSAALSLCYVASGAIDCYHIEDLKPWDLAAGVIIVREAGGIVQNSCGGTFDVMNPNIICAATEDLAKEMVNMIEEANQINEYKFL